MKRFEIVLLVAAGAVGGALIMKVAERPARLPVPAPAAVVAQASVPAPAPVPEPAAPQAPARPSPFAPPLTGNPEPVAVAQDEPPAVEPPKEEPAPPAQPVPPVRVEPENVTPPPPPAPEPHKVTLNTGMLLPVRLVDGLSSERNAPGDAFLATLDKELVVDGFVIAERGARVEGRIVASDPGGKVKRVAGIAVELTRLHTSDGQNVAIRTDSFERHAEPDRGKPATLPSETRISFRLRAPLTLTEQL